MPFYEVLCNTAETNFRHWPLGELPDRGRALAEFNATARNEGLGKFVFVRSPFDPHYILVEKNVSNGPLTLLWLRQAHRKSAMNWKRGLLLLWAIGSLAWIAFVIVAYDPFPKIFDPMVAYRGVFPFDETRAKGMSDDQIAAYLSRHAALDYGRLAVTPPAIFLAAIVGVWWGARKIRRPP